MDSLASLALATEEPTEDLLSELPYGRDEYIVSQKMVKHILGMAIYQSIIIFGIIFAGEYFIPEDDPKWQIDPTSSMIFPGRPYDWNGNELYRAVQSEYGPSRHMTIVFNVFVLLQVFNMINARKIKDEINVFEGIFKNKMFLAVFAIILVCQILLAQFAQDVMDCCRDGLTW